MTQQKSWTPRAIKLDECGYPSVTFDVEGGGTVVLTCEGRMSIKPLAKMAAENR